MGTETFSSRPFSLSNAISIVKLNNPLMGTETEKEKAVKNATNSEVKLNNPLMGTET